MEVYLIEGERLKRIPDSSFEQEQELEEHLVKKDGTVIGGVKLLYVNRQASPGEGGVFDLLGVDKCGNTVVVELKRARTPRKIVAQALEYASGIRNESYEQLEQWYRGHC
jgi:RecB family endonuclease NucS